MKEEIADRCMEIDLEDTFAPSRARLRADVWHNLRSPAGAARIDSIRAELAAQLPRDTSPTRRVALVAGTLLLGLTPVAVQMTRTDDQAAQGKKESTETLIAWLDRGDFRAELAEGILARRPGAQKPLLAAIHSTPPGRHRIPESTVRAARALSRHTVIAPETIAPLSMWVAEWIRTPASREVFRAAAPSVLNALLAMETRAILTDPDRAEPIAVPGLADWFHANNQRAWKEVDSTESLVIEEAIGRILQFEPVRFAAGHPEDAFAWATQGKLSYQRCMRWVQVLDAAQGEKDPQRRKLWAPLLIGLIRDPASARINASGVQAFLLPGAARALVRLGAGSTAAFVGHRTLLQVGDAQERLDAARALTARPTSIGVAEAIVRASMRHGWPPLVRESIVLLGTLPEPLSPAAIADLEQLAKSKDKGIATIAGSVLQRSKPKISDNG